MVYFELERDSTIVVFDDEPPEVIEVIVLDEPDPNPSRKRKKKRVRVAWREKLVKNIVTIVPENKVNRPKRLINYSNVYMYGNKRNVQLHLHMALRHLLGDESDSDTENAGRAWDIRCNSRRAIKLREAGQKSPHGLEALTGR